MKLKNRKNPGSIFVYLIIIVSLFAMMLFPVISNVTTEIKLIRSKVIRESALQIAEAGINYYQWRLAHFPTDYQDGTGMAGPYVHDYSDYDTGVTIGQYSLEITPPAIGSTIVTIKSTGWTNQDPGIKRVITAKFGTPSLALYTFLSNDVIWIGDTETVDGQLQANNGVRFDGIGNAPIQSAKLTYICSTSQGSNCPALKNGVWGTASAAVQAFWQFPAPAVDFSSVTAHLSGIKSDSQENGIYLPPSNAQGYSLVFNSDATVSIYKVTSLTTPHTGWDVNGDTHNESTDYSSRDLEFTVALPQNGIIFVEDNSWVEGVVNGRVTVAAATLPYNPTAAPTIYIPKNITYPVKDGTSVLGLIAQKDIVVTYAAPNNLEINAAMIAQNGSAQFFYYPNNIKSSITIYGTIMTYGQWTWSWVGGGGGIISGDPYTYNNYDSNLLYSPPPSFPVSTKGYQLLSWTSN